MNNFDEKYAPVEFNDLVFAEKAARDICETYVQRKPYKHLMLWGPRGTGKTATARVIVQTRYLSANFEGKPIEYNGSDVTKDTLNKLSGDLNYLSFQTGDPIVIINEFDEMSREMQPKFRSWMDRWPMMKFVVTTNEMPGIQGVQQKIMPSLVSRFTCVQLCPPKLDDWLPRVQAIFAAAGHAASMEDLKVLLGTYSDDVRDILPLIEAALEDMLASQPVPNKAKPNFQVISSHTSK